MKLTPQGSLRRNVGWMFIGQGIGYFLRLVYFILIARLLGVVQYGIVIGAYALVNMVAQYSRLGTGMVFLRYVSADHKAFSVYWGNLLLVTATTSGLLIALLHFIAPHLIDPASAGIIVLTAIGSCVCEQLTISATQAFQAFERMRVTALLNLLTSLARAVAAGAMLAALHHATARQWALTSMLVSVLVTIVALGTVTIQLGLPEVSLHLLRKRGPEGVEYAFASSTTMAYDDLDKAMLSHYGMNAAVGVYAMAYRIIEMATMPIASLQLAAEPRLFKLGASGLDQAADLGRRLLSKAVLVSLGVSVVLFVCTPAIPLLVGHGFQEGVSALRWLCLIPAFRSVHYITGSILTCAGLQRYRTLTQMAAALLNFGINLWLIPRYGWLGAAWASLFTDLTLGLMNWSVLNLTLRKRASRLNAEYR